jgi:hypothetical protein
MSSPPPLWRRAYDAVDRSITPHAESLVRTPTFAQGAALVRRVQTLARTSARDLTARAWHLVNLPAGSDVSRLRAQVGALDREVRRLTVALETERRRNSPPTRQEDEHGGSTESAGGARARAPRRRTQRPPGA